MAEESPEQVKGSEEATNTDAFAPHADRLAGKLDELREVLTSTRGASPAPEAPKEEAPQFYTTEQLEALVEDGKITAAQMRDQIRIQDAYTLRKEFNEKLEAQAKQQTERAAIEAKIAPYVQAMPDLKDESTDLYKQYDKRRKSLLSEGYPNDLRTWLTALRMEFGDKPGKSKIEETTTRETARDSTTPSAPSRKGGDRKTNGKNPFAGLEPREIEHYEKAIRAGRYTGLDDERLHKVVKRHLDNKSSRSAA